MHSNNELRRTVSGTPLYYSPELVLEQEYDEKIDIWSVGMMTYECLLGRIPFRIYSEFDLKRIVSILIGRLRMTSPFLSTLKLALRPRTLY